MSFDLFALHALQTGFSTPTDRLMAVFAARWVIFLLIALLGFAFFWKRSSFTKHELLDALWSLGLAFLMAVALGELFGRVRPFVAFPDLAQAWVPSPLSTTSFPSRHSAIAFAAAYFLHRHAKGPVVVVGWILAVLVAVGRVLVGVHYPSDVLAGALVGIVAVYLVDLGHRSLRSKDLNQSAKRHTSH